MLHEERNKLSTHTQDLKRAVDSLREEMEAVDWYQQRADACEDKNLKDILEHNRNEEYEHCAMIIERIRKQSPKFDEQLRKYLFSD